MHNGSGSTGSYASAMIDMVCVHRDYRGNRICPFLYQEAQRRLKRFGIKTIICTSGDDLPHPIGTLRYWHRPNPAQLEKLVACRFFVMRTQSVAEEMELYQVPKSDVKLREMTP